MSHDDLETIRKVIDRDELRAMVAHLEQRAFCYESPSDFRAGVEVMARHLEERLESEPDSAHHNGDIVKSSA